KTGKHLLKHASTFSKAHMLVVVAVFAVIGGYVLYHSFASAPLVASAESERMSASAPAGSAGFATNLKANSTVTTPTLWTFNPGTTTTAGYFYSDGVLLKKVSAPGPYVMRITVHTLTAGSH